MTDDDLYKILQIDPEAESEVVTAAYKCLVLKYHPDICRRRDATKRMQRINAAYDVLGDPEKRRRYDRSRKRKMLRPTPRKAAAPSAPSCAPTHRPPTGNPESAPEPSAQRRKPPPRNPESRRPPNGAATGTKPGAQPRPARPNPESVPPRKPVPTSSSGTRQSAVDEMEEYL